jgi:hypothetical protein
MPASRRSPSISARRSCDERTASDEHGGPGISGATDRLNICDKARLIPSPAEEDASPS